MDSMARAMNGLAAQEYFVNIRPPKSSKSYLAEH